jgi:hypothetical protein
MKPRFILTPLSQEDGTWVSFVTDWRDQARRVEPAVPLNEDAFGVLRSLAAGKLSIVGGSVSKAAVSAFRNNHDGRFYAVCMLNAAHLSGFDEPTLQVRHLLRSPWLASGTIGSAFYADVLTSTLAGVPGCRPPYSNARQVQIHLRELNEEAPVELCREALERMAVQGSVELQGACLRLTRSRPNCGSESWRHASGNIAQEAATAAGRRNIRRGAASEPFRSRSAGA